MKLAPSYRRQMVVSRVPSALEVTCGASALWPGAERSMTDDQLAPLSVLVRV